MERHAELQERIAELVTGRLSGPDRDRLERHLAECDACAEVASLWAELAAGLRAGGATVRDPHPSSAALVRWAGSAGPKGAADPIGRHVATCAPCALEVRAARRRDGVLEPAPARIPRFRIAGWAGAAAAAGVAAGLLLSGGIRGRGPSPAWSGAVDLLSLDGTLRGEEGAPVLTVAPDQPYVTIALLPHTPSPSSPESATVRVSIEDAGGRVAWTSTLGVEALDRYLETTGVLTILVPRDRLADGRYTVRVDLEGDRSAAPLLDAPFVFRSR